MTTGYHADADGLQWVRAGQRGLLIHFLDVNTHEHGPALCTTAPGRGVAWKIIQGREGIPASAVCRKCRASKAGRVRRAEKMAATVARNELHAQREACVRAGQLRPRSAHRTAAVRLADAEARWNQRHKVAR